MIAQWTLFIVSGFATYVGIALFAQLTGGASTSAGQALFSAIRPIPLAILIIANMVFALAVYYGYAVTRFAIPVLIAVGAITSVIYSVIFLGAQVTTIKIAGILLIIGGIVLLGL